MKTTYPIITNILYLFAFSNFKVGTTMLLGIYNSNFPQFHIEANNMYKSILKHNGISYHEMNLDQPDFWDKMNEINYFVFNWATPDDHHQIASTLLPIVDNYMKIKCFPDIKTCWHYDDKIKEYYLLNSKGYPFVKSWIFWGKESALKWAREANYPVVFKLKKGAGSTNVILINSEHEAKNIINKMFGSGIKANSMPNKSSIKTYGPKKYIKKRLYDFYSSKIKKIQPITWQLSKNYVLFQKFLPNNSYDTRITTIGNRVFASRRYVRKNDFRASGSGQSDFDHTKIDMRMVEMALQISQEMDFQTMSYDFLLNEINQPEICEISYDCAPKSITGCYGYWDENLVFREGRYLPQYLHLKDLLGVDNLLQPEIDIV